MNRLNRMLVFISVLLLIGTAAVPLFAQDDETGVTLVPFTDKRSGLSGVVPEGWNPEFPDTLRYIDPESGSILIIDFVPQQATADFLPTFLPQLGITETEEAGETYESPAFSWTLKKYDPNPQGGAPLVAALATTDTEDGVILVVLLTPDEQYETLHEAIFLPAIDALTLREDTQSQFIPLVAVDLGITGIVPRDWMHIAPSFAYSAPPPTVANLFHYVVPSETKIDPDVVPSETEIDPDELLANYLRAQFNIDSTALGDPIDSRETEFYTWDLYRVDQPLPGTADVTMVFDIALAKPETGTILIVLQTLSEGYDELHESIFLPLVEAVAPLSAGAPEGFTPFVNATFGFHGIVPQGWTDEIDPGATFSTPERTSLLLFRFMPGDVPKEVRPQLAQQFGLRELPEAVPYETETFTWEVYSGTVETAGQPGMGIDVALADTDRGIIIVALQTPADQYEDLHESAFFPVLDALAPLE